MHRLFHPSIPRALTLACTSADHPGIGDLDTTTGATATDPVPTTDTPTGPDDSTTSTTETTEHTTGSDPGCGNGVIEEGESCDDGHLLNSDANLCTPNCALNVCGDGLVYTGVEACDSGIKKKKTSTVDATLIAIFPSIAEIRWSSRPRSVIWDQKTIQDWGIADDRCRALADAGGLDNPAGFMAWISDDLSSPKTRFTSTTLPYVLPNGLRVAHHTAHLLASGPLIGITVTEQKQDLPYEWVWTGTAPNDPEPGDHHLADHMDVGGDEDGLDGEGTTDRQPRVGAAHHREQRRQGVRRQPERQHHPQ